MTRSGRLISTLQQQYQLYALEQLETQTKQISFFTNCLNIALPPLPTEIMAEALTNDNVEDLICTEEVLQLLNNIDTSKACGPDMQDFQEIV